MTATEVPLVVPKPRLFSTYVVRRIKQNKNFLCLTTGQTGSGKSYAMLAWAEELSAMLGTPFDISHVHFSVKDFLEALVTNDKPRGTVFILDEAGIAANSRKFMSVTNQALHFVAQSVRSYNNPIVLFTLPHAGFLDSGCRKLMHCQMETIGIDFVSKKVRVKPFLIQVNQREGYALHKYLRVRNPDTMKLSALKRLSFPHPSPELARAYESKKQAYLEGLYAELLAGLNEGKGKKDKDTGAVVLTDRQDEVLNLFKSGLNVSGAAEQLGMTIPQASSTKKALERHGFRFKPVKKGAYTTSYTVLEPEGGYV